MNIYTENSEIKNINRSVVTVGSFDGLHLGHLKILDEVRTFSDKINGSSFVITFEPHPRIVLSKDYDMKILSSLDEKKEIIEKAGIKNLMVINFTKEFSQYTSDRFIKKFIVDKLSTSHMVIGHDHKFGKDRIGNELKLIDLGKLFNFEVTAASPETLDGEIISSTKIRKALTEGDVEIVSLMLGRSYSLSGEIVKGAQRGRVLGFPTANTQLFETRKAVPENGVYIVHCMLEDEKYFGIMNIGYRPTFENKHELVLETHILNFDRDVYGKILKIEFLKRLRDEKKFESKEALIHQIELDKKTALETIKLIGL